jgi:hypothetical protein
MALPRALLALGFATIHGAACQEPMRKPLDENDVLFLLPSISGRALGDGIQVFPTPTSALVPLGELCRLLALGIEVNADQGRAQGFFITPKRQFRLDLATRSVQVEDRKLSFQDGQVQPFGNDLYVEARLLESWFPLEMKVEYRDSALYLKSKEQLPIQAAWDRDKQNARSLGSRSAGDKASALRYPFPYSFASIPTVDLSTSWQTSQRSSSAPPSASVALGGDLFWMSSQLYFSRDSTGSFKSSRGTLFREDPSGELLGPLHARRFSLGDMQQGAALELAGGLPQGRGFLVDNYPTSFRSSFAMRTFRGLLQEGWSVELYQNNGLIAFQRARPDGTYEFPSIPLRFGLNLFRLVFHGPLGQRREENHRFDIDQDQPEPGEFFYRVTGIRPTQQLLPDDVIVQNLDENRPAFLAEAEYGLTSYLSAKSGLMTLHSPLGSRDYGVAGFRTVLPFLSMEFMGATDRAKGEEAASTQGLAAEASLRTGFEYSSLQIKHAEYRRGFRPTAMLLAGRKDPLTLRKEDTVNLFTTLPGGQNPLNLGYQYQGQSYLEGGVFRRHRLQLSATLRYVSLSQSVGHSRDTSRGQNHQSLDGQSLVSTYFRDYQLQGSLQYQRTEGHTKMSSWGVTGNRHTESGMTYTGGIRGSGGGLKEASGFLNAMRQTGKFAYGADFGYSRSSGYSVGVRLQISLGREPRTGRWITDAQPMTGTGAVSARAFADDNYNGTFDAGERVLEGVQFRIAESEHPDRSPDPKVAVYTQIGSGSDMDIEVDLSTLEDAAQQPAVPKFTILPRPGTFMKVDYPVVIMGEITGTTRVRKNGRNEELAGLEIELLKESGEQIRVQRSAYDGYFEFRNLLPGDYRLRVTPRERERLKLKTMSERSLHIDLHKNLFEGQDLVIEFESQGRTDPPPPPSVDPPPSSIGILPKS